MEHASRGEYQAASDSYAKVAEILLNKLSLLEKPVSSLTGERASLVSKCQFALAQAEKFKSVAKDTTTKTNNTAKEYAGLNTFEKTILLRGSIIGARKYPPLYDIITLKVEPIKDPKA